MLVPKVKADCSKALEPVSYDVFVFFKTGSGKVFAICANFRNCCQRERVYNVIVNTSYVFSLKKDIVQH